MKRHGWTVPVLVVSAVVMAGCAEEEVEFQPAEEVAVPAETAGVAYAEWDTDADRQLSLAEYHAWIGAEGYFDRWNTDGTDGLTGDEMAAGALSIWDDDGDGRLSETEWREGVNQWYTDTSFGEYADWDVDKDGYLGEQELSAGFEQTGLLETWDRDGDGIVQETEFNDGVFRLWDDNADSYLDEGEWETGRRELGMI